MAWDFASRACVIACVRISCGAQVGVTLCAVTWLAPRTLAPRTRKKVQTLSRGWLEGGQGAGGGYGWKGKGVASEQCCSCVHEVVL